MRKLAFCSISVLLLVFYALPALAESPHPVFNAQVDPNTITDTAQVWLFGAPVGWPAPSVVMGDLSPLALYSIDQVPLLAIAQVRSRVHYMVHPQYCQGSWAEREIAAVDSSVAILDSAMAHYGAWDLPSGYPVYEATAPGDPGSWLFDNPQP